MLWILTSRAALAFAPAADDEVAHGYIAETSGDFDGDGYDDLVVNDGACTVYPGSASGLQAARAARLSGSQCVSLDANGDGFRDLVTVTLWGGGRFAAELHLGSPTGLQQASAWNHDFYPSWAMPLVTGDVTGDGRDDLFVAENSAYGSTVYLFEGTPQGLARQPVLRRALAYGQRLDACALSDLDGDGFADLAIGRVRSGATGRIDVYAGSANGLAAQPSRSVNGPQGYRVAAGLVGGVDLDGDGVQDLGVTDENDRIAVVYGSTAGPLAIAAVGGAPPNSGQPRLVSAGDVDGDGRDDLLASWSLLTVGGLAGAGGAELLLGGTTVPAPGGPLTLAGVAVNEHAGSSSTAGDFDGDGSSDWVVGSTTELGVVYGP